jgi:hypothetical protein
VVKKKIWANLQRIIELSTQNIVIKLSKIWVWDPVSGIWRKPIPDPGSRMPDPGVKKAPDPGSGSGSTILVKYLIIFHPVVLLISILVEMTDGCSPF